MRTCETRCIVSGNHYWILALKPLNLVGKRVDLMDSNEEILEGVDVEFVKFLMDVIEEHDEAFKGLVDK